MSDQTSRRTFLKTTAVAGAAVAAGSILTLTPREASAKTIKLAAEGGKLVLKLEDYPDLKETFKAAKVKETGSGQRMYVIQLEDEKYIAISSKCTHTGCQVRWDKKDHVFNCACHHSAFDIEGKPSGGPAEKPLPMFPIELKDGALTITFPEAEK